jgi:hypothetical protein
MSSLQSRKLRHKGAKPLVQGHTAKKGCIKGDVSVLHNNMYIYIYIYIILWRPAEPGDLSNGHREGRLEDRRDGGASWLVEPLNFKLLSSNQKQEK